MTTLVRWKEQRVSEVGAVKKHLATLDTLAEVRDFSDKLEGIRVYAKAAGAPIPVINAATAGVLLSQQKAGEMLAELERPNPREAKSSAKLADDSVYRSAFKELARNGEPESSIRRRAQRWQLLAAAKELDITGLAEAQTEQGEPLTFGAVYSTAAEMVYGKKEQTEWTTKHVQKLQAQITAFWMAHDTTTQGRTALRLSRQLDGIYRDMLADDA